MKIQEAKTILVFGVLALIAPRVGVGATGDARAPLAEPARDLRSASAYIDTFVIAEFDFEGMPGPDPQGWTSVDRTIQEGIYWHVDTFMVPTGGGSQAMWCGARPDTVDPLCTYGCLPGYGNDWKQMLETPTPITVQGNAGLSFIANWDTEPTYDYLYIEYLNSIGDWVELEAMDGVGTDESRAYSIPAANLGGTTRFRFRFESDGGYSDEDCNFISNGAVQIDNLTVSDSTGVLHFEDFEGESVGAQATDDGFWVATIDPGYGDYAGMLDASTLFLPTPDNDSHVWGFTHNSPRTCQGSYNCDVPCGPDTLSVVNGRGWDDDETVLANEIWSPVIDWTRDTDGNPVDTAATVTLLQFKVYRNLTLMGGMFYDWRVRSFDASPGCGEWGEDGYIGYYGYQGDWYEFSLDISAYIDAENDSIQIALGAFDWSRLTCHAIPECGDCLTVSPLFDDVQIIRCTPAPTAVAETPTPETTLEVNYPNPFNPTTTIRYTIAERSHVSLQIYDVAGRLVRTLVDDVLSPEQARPVEWHGTDSAGRAVASGVYFYRLSAGGVTHTRKLVLLK